MHNITKEEYSAEHYSNHGGLGQDSTKYKDLPYDGYPYSLIEHEVSGLIMPKTFSYLKQTYFYDSEYWKKNNEDVQNSIDDILKNVHI